MRYIVFLFLTSVALKASAIEFTSSYKEHNDDGNFFADIKNKNYLSVPNARQAGDTAYWQFPSEYISDSNLGNRHRPMAEIRHIKRTGDTIVYDAIYSFDEFGRRMAPIKNIQQRDKFLILYGCSFTYGNALNDNQTLNYFLGQNLPDYYPYNYAIGATGTNSMLAVIQEDNFKQQIPYKKGVFVYVEIDSHIDRAAGLNPNLSWLKDTPYYEKTEHGLERKGTFMTGRPIFTWSLLQIQKLFNWIGSPNVIFPKVSKKHLDYVCDLVVESKKEFSKQYPDSTFLMYFHPMSGSFRPELQECLKANNVSYYIGTQISGRQRIEGDGHPNELANRAVAAELAGIIRSLK